MTEWFPISYINMHTHTHTHTDTHTPHILFIHLLTGMWVASIIGYCKSCCTVCISFQISVCILFRYIPRSGIDGLYVSSIFWETFTLFSIVAAPTYNSTNSIPRFPFPGGSGGKESTCKCWRPRFDPWVRMITRRREWWPTPVFSPREFPEQRSLEGYSPRGHKEGDMIDWLTHSLSQHPTRLLSFVDFLIMAILMCEVISLFCYAFLWLVMLSIFHVPIGHLSIFGEMLSSSVHI